MHKHGSTSFIAFMDASKAFDRVNHGTLIHILHKKGIPLYILRILVFWFSHSEVCVQWGSVMSDSFMTINGVRQGGILSPLFFNIYVNEISEKLNSKIIGCSFKGMRINHLMYADDIVLFCPSAKGLQELINCCVYEGNKLDLRFNENKTVYMTALSKFDCHCKNQLPDIYINDKALSLVDTYKYLGHYISSNLVDDKDILTQVQANYAKGNMLCNKFSDSSSEVKGVLFKTYMYSMYTMSLWSNYSNTTYRKFVVSYNNIFRMLFKQPMYCSASNMFVSKNICSLPEIRRISCYSLLQRINTSDNALMVSYLTTCAVKLSTILKIWNKYVYM